MHPHTRTHAHTLNTVLAKMQYIEVLSSSDAEARKNVAGTSGLS